MSLTNESNSINNSNTVENEDRAIHEWYRFVLSYPPHLVRHYINKFNVTENELILDPFCGTGTTLVEAKLNGFQSIGVEAHPFSHFASQVKIDWSINEEELIDNANSIADNTLRELRKLGIDDSGEIPEDLENLPLPCLDEERNKLLIKNSISPIPLQKSLFLISKIDDYSDRKFYNHFRLALADALVQQISNLRFGPEVGVGKVKSNSEVVMPWLRNIQIMAKDLSGLSKKKHPKSQSILDDSRNIGRLLPSNSVDIVITSPPYPNEKDYTRTTRLESVLLGFINTRSELRSFKKDLVRSNTRGVYKADTDDEWIQDFPEIHQIADSIEARRIELGKTSGFEKLYHRVTKLYFGGMAKHLVSIKDVLRPGARLAYVVGDQASYLRVKIQTGQILAKIADHLGYEVCGIDLFRKRFSTATREELREEVVLLKWNGES